MTDSSTPPPVSGSFDFNGPTIVSLLYLSSFFLGITGIVGVVLGYVWKGEARPAWELTHYRYLIRTFWIGFIGSIVGVILLLAVIGAFILLGVAVLVIVRSVLALLAAQKQQPMPNPDSWTI